MLLQSFITKGQPVQLILINSCRNGLNGNLNYEGGMLPILVRPCQYLSICNGFEANISKTLLKNTHFQSGANLRKNKDVKKAVIKI